MASTAASAATRVLAGKLETEEFVMPAQVGCRQASSHTGVVCVTVSTADMIRGKSMRKLVMILVLSCTCTLPLSAAEPDFIEFLNSGKVLPANLPFSEAVRVGKTLYLSGQIGNVPGTLKLVPGGIGAESRQTLGNIRRSLEAHGYS